ncbi:hypothetical protein NVP1199A_55 [Vibrio phage 1.199.A._10N.286.55.C10]|nr:hypothetical protein NVP1199A_55 [Vibrio phage 1.199.A._10N.286.55.C10]AUR94998.1 hypothetical protein NVP1199B_55 [Vibrio phage 1.199.B._10N.286.55.C10]
MAIRKDVDYPGRWEAATTEYPMGKPKNRTTSTSKDGSYFEKKWFQDYEAFFGALLNEAEVSPNGSVDTAESSQFFDALTSKINGDSSFTANGYQKLPSGLIIQWMLLPDNFGSEATAVFPIPFPNDAIFLGISQNGLVGTPSAFATQIDSPSQCKYKGASASGTSSRLIAIGY